MFNDGPDPDDPVYQLAARTLLNKMREVCRVEREALGEVEESWPNEIRLFPASTDTAEGVLYMPRALPPVYVFQCLAVEDDSGTIITHMSGFAPMSLDILDLAIDYQKRAAQHVFTCTCGHVIPKITAIPLGFIEDHEAAESDDLGEAEAQSKEEERIRKLIDEQETDYACPACGFRPNKNYD